MSQEIFNELETALNDTLHLLSSFNEKEMNTVPFQGSWTAAQVCRHLFKAEDGIDGLFYAPGKVAEREPDQRAGQYKEIFMDFETKMQSPDFIYPEEKEYKKEELTEPLKEANKKLLEAAKKVNLSEEASLPDEHPLKGSTKLELVYFITYHTMRHNHQLKKIREAIN